ncbi:hypothetical protein P280DRAFT_514941 [Massarina eburnea CBS 473.64]|uniref:Uncharacterized protein n=1 Tax=Massarina eburnea CBS 473.64 TaxID=1395130 RepID=A0A6A6S7W8_9PLEO|nr:hypothetical protein P280DRAFT_514941 [Massarina eburnea CBS 473.64]
MSSGYAGPQRLAESRYASPSVRTQSTKSAGSSSQAADVRAPPVQAIARDYLVDQAAVRNYLYDQAPPRTFSVDQAPARNPLTVQAPAVQSPAVQTPARNSLVGQAPAAHPPAVHSPAVRSPAVQSPAVHSPAVHSPAVQSPAVQATPAETVVDRNGNGDTTITADENASTGSNDLNAGVKLANSASGVETARKLLLQLREKVICFDSAGLDVFDPLWQDLEHLYKDLRASQAALPALVETHEKYTTRVGPRLRELDELTKYISRLTLDHGLLRAQHDRLANQTGIDADNYEKERKSMTENENNWKLSYKALEAEYEGLQDVVDTLEKAGENEIKANYKEISQLQSEYVKEVTKVQELDATIKALRSSESEAKQAVSKLISDFNLLDHKYSNKCIECEARTEAMSAANKRVATLTTVVGNFHKQNTTFARKLEQVPNLEKEAADLRKDIAALTDQLAALDAEKEIAFNEAANAKKELDPLVAKHKKLEKEKSHLEYVNNELFGQQVEHKKKSNAALAILKDENLLLRATVKNLEQPTSDSSSRASSRQDMHSLQALQEKLDASENSKADLENTLKGWRTLAEESYAEYKEIVPVYKQADALRQENEKLKAKLKQGADGNTNGVGGNSNGVGGNSSGVGGHAGADGDATYWRTKYEGLLSSFE